MSFHIHVSKCRRWSFFSFVCIIPQSILGKKCSSFGTTSPTSHNFGTGLYNWSSFCSKSPSSQLNSLSQFLGHCDDLIFTCLIVLSVTILFVEMVVNVLSPQLWWTFVCFNHGLPRSIEYVSLIFHLQYNNWNFVYTTCQIDLQILN
jgi:hypothetical protein